MTLGFSWATVALRPQDAFCDRLSGAARCVKQAKWTGGSAAGRGEQGADWVASFDANRVLRIHPSRRWRRRELHRHDDHIVLGNGQWVSRRDRGVTFDRMVRVAD